MMIKKLIAISFFLLSFFVDSSHAYDWDKCRRSLSKLSKDDGLYGGIATTSIFPVQFSSSWGACSAMGKPEDDRKAFYNDNYESLRINFSENRGECLMAFVSYYHCSDVGEAAFIKKIRTNYKAIFGKINYFNERDLIYPAKSPENQKNWREDWNVSPEDSFRKLQKIIEIDEVVSKECKSLKL